jgi:hypothetical protein
VSEGYLLETNNYTLRTMFEAVCICAVVRSCNGKTDEASQYIFSTVVPIGPLKADSHGESFTESSNHISSETSLFLTSLPR